jgi:hypothetical protein
MENPVWIPDEFNVRRLEGVDAFDQSGSELHSVSGVFPQSGLSFDRDHNVTELLLRPEDQVAYIDHLRRIFSVQNGALRGWPYWEQDNAQCSTAAGHYAYLSGRLADSVIAGTPVVGYSGRDAMGTDYKVYFAPSIGCQDFSFQMLEPRQRRPNNQ